jgi:uncharacterized protein YjiS (DUF1127 family)
MEENMNILANLIQANRRRLAARQLRALSPRLLRDIGVEPDRIDETVTQMLAAQAHSQAKSPRPPAVFSHTGDWPYSTRRAA